MATNSDGGATGPRSAAISRLEEKAREMASQSTHPDAASFVTGNPAAFFI